MKDTKIQGHDIKSEEEVLKFATDRAGELFRLSEDLNGEILNLEPVTLLNETKVMLDETKSKYLKLIEGYFEVGCSLNYRPNLRRNSNGCWVCRSRPSPSSSFDS